MSLFLYSPHARAAFITFYCRSGRMSLVAGTALNRQGCTNLSNLKGGMIAWQGPGYPIEL